MTVVAERIFLVKVRRTGDIEVFITEVSQFIRS